VTDSPAANPSIDWESEGRRLSETLDRYNAIVIIGADANATATVGLAVAKAQARWRRVVLGDLLGDAPPIRSLVTGDDPHGLVDSFEYGVSLNRIAVPVSGVDRLFVMPTGSQPPEYSELLPHPRWRRLTEEFREAGALLVLVAPAGATHIEDLVASTDGSVQVGEGPLPQLPPAFILAVVRGRREPRPAAEVRKLEARRRRRKRLPRSVIYVAMTVLALVGAFGLRTAKRRWSAGRRAAALAADSSAARRRAAAESAARVTDSTGAAAFPAVVNPADARSASIFAVELMAANTQTGAILKLQRDSRFLPAATYAPVMVDGVRWFKVFAGAYTVNVSAESLLLSLGRRGLLGDGSGVVRVPYAFLVDTVSATAAPAVIAAYAERGLPVYGLLQLNGSVSLYAGAFETPAQAQSYAESLRAAGNNWPLVYRKGRVF
jgi:hypothetical protein